MAPKAAQGSIEKRTFGARELRVAGENGSSLLTGHAAVFNQLSEDFGGWFERIASGAFTESLAADDVRCLRDHDPGLILGRNKSGTLRLKEDAQGLAVECDLPDTSYSRDLAVSVGRGDISQMSFGFSVESPEDEMWDNIDGKIVRTVLRAKLYDVSPVTYPAYPTTDVNVAQRSFERFQAQQPPPEQGPSLDELGRELQLLEIE